MVMKKLILALIISLTLTIGAQSAFAENEIIEDYLDIATSYAVGGNYASAMEYLDKILLMEPQNKEIAGLKNTLRQMQNGRIISPMVKSDAKLSQAQSAKAAGNKAVELQVLTANANAGGYWANMFAADFFKNAKQYSKAIPYYQKAANSTNSSSAPLLGLGTCYFYLKNYNEAYPVLTQFIAHNQQESYAYAMRARALTEMGRYNDAETDIVTAIALEDSIEYRYLEGLILFKRGNFKKAQMTLEKIAPQIQTSDVYKFLGLSYYATGDLKNALLNLDKAILLSNDDNDLKLKYNEVKSKLTAQGQK